MPLRRTLLPVLLLAGLAACGKSTPTDPEPPAASLSGTVFLVASDGSRTPAPGRIVTVDQCQPNSFVYPVGCQMVHRFVTADTNGRYLFPDLYASTVQLATDSPAGYRAYSVNFVLAAGANERNIDLSPQ